MPKTKLIPSNVEYQFYEDFYNGSGWGAATSHPFITETYFTPEETAEVKRLIKDMHDRAEATMAKIPASKRVSDDGLCGQVSAALKEFAVPNYSTDYKNPIYNFRGIVDLYAGAIYAKYNGRGRYKYTVILRETDKIFPKIEYYKNEESPDYGYGRRVGVTYSIHWSESKQTYVLREYVRVSTGPVPESKRGRNWARKQKRNEFSALCASKFKALLKEGFVFSKLEYETDCGERFEGYLFRRPEDDVFIKDFYAKKEEEKRLAEEKAKADAEAAKSPEQRAYEKALAEASKKAAAIDAETEAKIKAIKEEAEAKKHAISGAALALRPA